MNPLSLNGFNGSPWLGQKENLRAWIEGAAAAGFALYAPDCPSLTAWRERGDSYAALARLMRDAGVGCAVITVCGMLDGSAGALSAFPEAMRAAEALGASLLQVNVSAPDAPAQVDAVAQACEAVRGTGLRLAIEYMPITPLATLAQTLAIVDAVGAQHAGALVDNWHHAHDPAGWETLAAAPLDAVAYAEFSDALPPASGDLVAEMMDRRTMPGAGVLDCARFAALLRARGYTGMVSVEVLNREWRNQPPADFARACHAAAAPYWA